jgi:sugar fermentation stimulation protein A
MIIKVLKRVKYVERPNRFTVVFDDGDIREKAHLRDPGRLKELLIPGTPLIVRKAINPEFRKTKFDVIASYYHDQWVLINSGFHSDLAEQLIESGNIIDLNKYQVFKREYTYGKSRIDFLLTSKEQKMLLEVKGCTLVENGQACFPDAPTERGKKHVEELITATENGFEASIIFLILRKDAEIFTPNWKMDPNFSQSLQDAAKSGVKILAYSFKNTLFKDELHINPYKQVKTKLNTI